MKWEQAKGWLSSSMGDELVMMSVENGNYVSVSRVGARIYELLKAPSTLDALCARLVEDYEVEPEQCRTEVEAFIGQMIAQGAIRQVP
jgi:hypothetical protein